MIPILPELTVIPSSPTTSIAPKLLAGTAIFPDLLAATLPPAKAEGEQAIDPDSEDSASDAIPIAADGLVALPVSGNPLPPTGSFLPPALPLAEPAARAASAPGARPVAASVDMEREGPRVPPAELPDGPPTNARPQAPSIPARDLQPQPRGDTPRAPAETRPALDDAAAATSSGPAQPMPTPAASANAPEGERPSRIAPLIAALVQAPPARAQGEVRMPPKAAPQPVADRLSPLPAPAKIARLPEQPETPDEAEPLPAAPRSGDSVRATGLQPVPAPGSPAASIPNPQPVDAALVQIAAAPSPTPSAPAALSEPRAETRPVAQLEATIEQLVEARESGRAARPELTLRHAEFGAINVRLEALGNDLRATVNARDPGFVPAIHAALADRGIAATHESTPGQSQRGSDQSPGHPSSHGGSGGAGAGQGQHSEGRYGSSPGSGQGSPSPYFDQNGASDEEAGSQARSPADPSVGERRGNTGLFA